MRAPEPVLRQLRASRGALSLFGKARSSPLSRRRRQRLDGRASEPPVAGSRGSFGCSALSILRKTLASVAVGCRRECCPSCRRPRRRGGHRGQAAAAPVLTLRARSGRFLSAPLLRCAISLPRSVPRRRRRVDKSCSSFPLKGGLLVSSRKPSFRAFAKERDS